MASMNNDAKGSHPNVIEVSQQQFENKIMDLASEDKRFVKLIGSYDDFYKTLADMSKKSTLSQLEEQHKLFQANINKELNESELSADRRKELEEKLIKENNEFKKKSAKEVQRIQDKAIDVTLAKQTNSYKYASIKEKAEIAKTNAERLDAWVKLKQKEADETLAAEEGNKEAQLAAIQEAADARRLANNITRSQQFEELNSLEDGLKNFKKNAEKGDFSVIKSVLKLSSADLDRIANDSKKRAEGSKKEFEEMKKDYKKMEDAGASEEELLEKMNELKKQEVQVLKDEMSSAMADLAANFKEGINKQFQAVESLVVDYKAKIEGRLQGSDKSYDSVMNKIASNLSTSPYVKTTDVIKEMQKAAEQGLAYNIEQRSFLSTISEKIAATFDAFDSNLTRLIRLQQADTTAARLGMEASLTKFFNSMFQDSSYLNDVADSISAAIIDANSTMSRDMSASFEYTVQKWLGSLSSLGMDSGTLQNIAQGINYIATGDVQSLSSNTSLQTLFAMSASNAGLSYSDLLLNGLDASSTNKLLQSMVTYLKEIAENSDNQVVRAAYGDIFNMSMSDLKAVSNLTTGDIKTIAANSMSYSDMTDELQYQFSQQAFRTTFGSMVNTLYENAIFGVAEDLVSDPISYSMYKMLHFLEERNLDMAIPFVNAAGFGLDLNTSVQDILNLGLGISNAVSLVGNILSGLGSKGGMKLDAWGGSEYTTRGNGLTFSTQDSGKGVSSSTYVASSNSQDMKTSALSSAADDAEESAKITNKNLETGYTVDDLYKAVIEGGEPYVRVQEAYLGKVYHSKDSYLHTRDTRMAYTRGSYLRTYDMAFESGMGEVDEYLRAIKSNTQAVSESNSDLLTHFIKAGNILAGLAVDASRERISVSSSTDSLMYSAVRVTNNSTDTTGLDVFVTNTKDIKPDVQTVKLQTDAKVDLNKDTLVAAFKEALGFSSRGSVTLAEILKDIYSGNTSIAVKTHNGETLDTQLSSTTVNELRTALL